MKVFHRFLALLFPPSDTPEPDTFSSNSDHINQEMYKKSVELSDKNKTLSLLQKIDEIIIGSITHQNEVAGAVTSLLVTEADFQLASIYLYNKEKNALECLSFSHAHNEGNTTPQDRDIPLHATDNLLVQAITDRAVKSARSLVNVIPNGSVATDTIKSVLVYPLIVRGDLIGAMVIGLTDEEADISLFKKDLVTRLSEIIGIAMDNAVLYSRVQQANDRLKELDQLKNEFVSVASHELRTPMTAIKSYMWMVIEGRGGPVTDKQRFYLERAYSSVDRLIKMVNDMLNISRIESGKLSMDVQSVQVEKVAQEVVDEVQPRAQELGVHVRLEPFTALPQVIADPDKIKEVLFNLIGNSLKFTPKDGTITVTLAQNNNFVEIKVRDTGAGVEPAEQSKLFQKFGLLPGSYTANQAAMGTGLGLYICKSIVELHGGRIWMYSEGRGKGAEFGFTLKAYNEKDFQELSQKFQNQSVKKLGIIHTQF